MYFKNLITFVTLLLEKVVLEGCGRGETLWKKVLYAASIGESVEEKEFERNLQSRR